MSEIIQIGITAILALMNIVLIVERASMLDQHKAKEDKLLEENSRLVKAIIAKNANEYVMTTSIDKVPSEQKAPADPDLIPEESLNDEQFFDSIGKQLKDTKN